MEDSKPPIIYYPEIFNEDMAEIHFDTLKDILQAKQVLCYTDIGYSYTYNRKKYNGAGWNKQVLSMVSRIQQQTGYKFNCAIVEYFRDGNATTQWRSDSEKELGHSPLVAIMSFGATRELHFKHLITHKKYIVTLEPGSLGLMERGCQEERKYCLPVSKKKTGKRISLTCRYLPQKS